MSIPIGELKQAIENGLVQDLLRAERAYRLMMAIGTRAAEINTGKGNFGRLFFALQSALRLEALMATSRMYDHSKKHTLRSIPAIRGYLEQADDPELDIVREPSMVIQSLGMLEPTDELIRCAEFNPKQFRREFADLIRRQLEMPDRMQALRKLREIRDKSLAHHEHIDLMDAPTWGGVHELINLAAIILEVLGWAYFGAGWGIAGENFLLADAQRPVIALNRMIDQLLRTDEIVD